MYGRKTPSTYRSTPSVYSHYTGRSSTNLRSSKSVKSLRLPWYMKPILHDAFLLDLQRGSLLTGFVSIFIALFTFAQSIFDLYCLGMAAPGAVHYGYYEYEKKIVPWLYTFGVFILFRTVAFIFAAIVNDMIFSYNVLMCLCWVVFCVVGVYGWLLVYSLYLELADLTKLEDLAHLRMGTMASLNASLAGSRPTTPHSTVSTMPASQI
ncbi:hypothetical protein RR48_05601 [Papilio machaon]|uniref:Uncharacterized protein n=1 Tax=Papilio machaon TaxID=76193 RepID=A0A0N1IHV2_PAPMA|nr:hypothetical protein RR48_05601 [Papilio machaon]